MYVVTEADAAAIREVYELDGAIRCNRTAAAVPRHPGQRQGQGASEAHRSLEAATTTASACPEATERQGIIAVCRQPAERPTRWLSRAAGAIGQRGIRRLCNREARTTAALLREVDCTGPRPIVGASGGLVRLNILDCNETMRQALRPKYINHPLVS